VNVKAVKPVDLKSLRSVVLLFIVVPHVESEIINHFIPLVFNAPYRKKICFSRRGSTYGSNYSST
jgi:hypothetical protein